MPGFIAAAVRPLLLVLFVLAPLGGFAQDVAPAEEPAAAAPESPAGEARALIEVLRSDTAREALISELETLAGDASAEAEDVAAGIAEDDEPAALSFGRRIALATQESAEAIAGQAARLWSQITRAPNTFSALDGLADSALLLDALEALALVILTTYAAFLILRVFARGLYRRMGAVAAEAGAARTVVLAVASVAIDAAVVALAWAAGYAITITFFGEFGSIGIRQTLYLNAFLGVEMARVAIRAVLSPSTEELRFVSISDAAARYLTRWSSGIVLLLGYGELLVVPIVNQNVSYLAGRALSSFVAMIAILIVMGLVIRARRPVADWLIGDGEGRIRIRFVNWVVRHWHWPVLAYLLVLLAIVVARPGGLLFPILGASTQILVAMVAGMVVTGALTRAMLRGVSLPDPLTTRLPLLERRLNTFVPSALFVLRLFVFLAVAVFAADVIGLIDARGWLETQVGVRVTAIIISVAMILLVAFLVWLALSSWVDYRLNPEFGKPATARENTLLTLLRNAATIAIIVITLMFVLSEMGIDIAPLLASAGVLGLAIGFGAQKMVQDIITGVFIQFENAMNVGDVVTVSGTTGTVERLTIRSVSLRDLFGTYHLIPFSSVDMVSNFNKGFAYFVMDMGIAYQEDINEARAALEEAFELLRADKETAAKLLGDLEWFGLQSFGDSAVVVRARVKTLPGTQWGVGRKYNEVVKQVFDARGIEIPFPHQTIYWGEERKGRTPPLRVAMEGPAPATEAGPTEGGGTDSLSTKEMRAADKP